MSNTTSPTDKMRFIQRVLESDAPVSDRETAAQYARDLRRADMRKLSLWFIAHGEGEDKRSAFVQASTAEEAGDLWMDYFGHPYVECLNVTQVPTPEISAPHVIPMVAVNAQEVVPSWL